MQLNLINGETRLLSFENMKVIEKESQPLKDFWPALRERNLDTLEKKIEKIFAILRLPQQFTLEHLHASRVNRASEAASYYYDPDEVYSGASSWTEHCEKESEGALADALITTILLSVYPEVSQILVSDAKELSTILRNQKAEIKNVTNTDFEISYRFKYGREDHQLVDKEVEKLGLKIITSTSDFHRSFTRLGDRVTRTLKIERYSLLNFDTLKNF